MPQKFIALMLTAWVGTVLGDAIYFNFVKGPLSRFRT